MPIRYNPDTGVPEYHRPPIALELSEGETPEPVEIVDKRKFFAGDGPPKKKPEHIPIAKEFDAAIERASPGDADRRYASDEEVAMLEQVARKVLHWPLLLGVINRLREAERKLATR